MKTQSTLGRKVLAGMLSLGLLAGYPTSAFANDTTNLTTGDVNAAMVQEASLEDILVELDITDPSFAAEEQLMDDDLLLDDDVLKGNNNDKQKFTVRQQIEAKINVLEKQIAALEKKLKTFGKFADKKQVKQIEKLIEEKEDQLESLEERLEDFIKDTKKDNLSNYSDKELSYIDKIEAALEKSQNDIKIIPVENIVTDAGTVKLDMPMAIKNDVIYMPISGFQKGLGAKVDYLKANKKFIIKKDGVLIEMFLENNMIEVDGVPKKASARPIVVGDKVLLPVNDIAQALKVKFTYSRSTNTLMIETKVDSTKAPITTVGGTN